MNNNLKDGLAAADGLQKDRRKINTMVDVEAAVLARDHLATTREDAVHSREGAVDRREEAATSREGKIRVGRKSVV